MTVAASIKIHLNVFLLNGFLLVFPIIFFR